MTYDASAYTSFIPRRGERREPVAVLLLGVLTFHLYYLYWIHETSRELTEFDGMPDTPPALEVLLSLLSCGLYTVYWDFKTAQKIARVQAKVGLPPSDNSILYLLLNLVVLGLVPSMVMQWNLNDVWQAAQRNLAAHGSYYAPSYIQ